MRTAVFGATGAMGRHLVPELLGGLETTPYDAALPATLDWMPERE